MAQRNFTEKAPCGVNLIRKKYRSYMVFGSATLRGSVSAETAFPRASHPKTLPTTAITMTLHEALGKAVSSETSLDTKFSYH